MKPLNPAPTLALNVIPVNDSSKNSLVTLTSLAFEISAITSNILNKLLPDLTKNLLSSTGSPKL